MLSVGATFAADNATDAVAADNEITIDEPLAVEQDVQEVSENESAADTSAAVITPSTIGQYIGESGQLYENVTADELIFEGTFDNLNLTVERPITVTGGIFNDPNFEIYSSNVILKNFTILQDKGYSSIFVAGNESNYTENVTVSDVEIGFTDDQNGAGAVPIHVLYSDNFVLSDSSISYIGKTNGNYMNNIIRIESSRNALIYNNKFTADLVSVPVGWAEEPAGSGNWVSSPMSEGIVVKNSEGVAFDGNNVTIYCSNSSGDWDTIYAVDFSGSDESIITNNKIIAHGNTYIYGIILSGDDFIIRSNDIKSIGVYYANGIDIEGPATGVVEDNVINVKANTSAYGIYSGMNGQNVSANYTGNNITGDAYNVFGFSLGDVESNVKDNYINLNGNYTTGLAARTGVLDVTGNRFVLLSSEVGNETILEGFGVAARGIFAMTGNVTIDNNVISTEGAGVYLTGVDAADVKNNFINVVANADKDAYAIYAGVLGGLTVTDNNIDYEGDTQGTGVNNALFIAGTDDAIVANNNFTIDLVSSYVPWAEEPAGSGNWVSSPVSEGIVVRYSDNVVFDGNKVNVTYGDVVGSYDTIYVVDFAESDGAVITNNDIVANGNTYIYGIILSGDDFVIRANNITSTGVYYANGIDIEGPATGVVEDNKIEVNAETSAYGIYSGMNGQNVSANYTNNWVSGNAYNIFGFSLGDVESNIENNFIYLGGNYTTGIAYRGTKLTADKNIIGARGSNVGDKTIWESFGVESIGIKVVNGTSTIVNNDIDTTGNYAIDVKDTEALVHDNVLLGKKFAGDESVNNAANSDVYNNTPNIEDKTATVITVNEVDGDCNVSGIITDSYGSPIANDEIVYSFNGTNSTVKTDANGAFNITGIDNGKLELFFAEDSYYSASNASITLRDIGSKRLATQFNVTEGQSIPTYAVDFNAGEQGQKFKFQLTDANGNPIANAKVQFAYKTVIINRTTNANGIVSLGVSTQFADSYLCALSYLGDETHDAAFVAFNFKLSKKPITISAAKKTYKVSTKTKKYTVTLKTKKCASRDGKVYLKAGKKVTLKINGKTYSGKINSKGKVTFKITNLKKRGKFVALIKFAGDKTYESASKKVTLTVK